MSYVVAVAAAGVDNGIIPAIASRYLSPRGLSIVALILVPSGYLLTWNAFFWREFHQRHPALLVLYLGMAGTHTVVFFKRLGSKGHVALDRNPGPGYDTLLFRMIPGDLLRAFPHRQFHTLPGLLDSRAALPNSYPNACMPMQGGSLYHFYDGLWYGPARPRGEFTTYRARGGHATD